MAKRPRLAKVAVVRGEFALLVFQDAASDGRIESHELPSVLDAMQDWMQVVKATNAAQALGDAIERGVEDPHYFGQLMSGYRSVIDELPVPA